MQTGQGEFCFGYLTVYKTSAAAFAIENDTEIQGMEVVRKGNVANKGVAFLRTKRKLSRN